MTKVYLRSGFNWIMSAMGNYTTFPDEGEEHEEVISNSHRWAGVISSTSLRRFTGLSLNIRQSSGPIVRHLLNSWTIQGVCNKWPTHTDRHTHTHTTQHRYQDYPVLVVSKNIQANIRGSFNSCSCAQYLMEQILAQFVKQLKSYSNRKTSSPLLICPWWLPVPQDCAATGAMVRCGSSTYSYTAIPTSVII